MKRSSTIGRLAFPLQNMRRPIRLFFFLSFFQLMMFINGFKQIGMNKIVKSARKTTCARKKNKITRYTNKKCNVLNILSRSVYVHHFSLTLSLNYVTYCISKLRHILHIKEEQRHGHGEIILRNRRPSNMML